MSHSCKILRPCYSWALEHSLPLADPEPRSVTLRLAVASVKCLSVMSAVGAGLHWYVFLLALGSLCWLSLGGSSLIGHRARFTQGSEFCREVPRTELLFLEH